MVAMSIPSHHSTELLKAKPWFNSLKVWFVLFKANSRIRNQTGKQALFSAASVSVPTMQVRLEICAGAEHEPTCCLNV